MILYDRLFNSLSFFFFNIKRPMKIINTYSAPSVHNSNDTCHIHLFPIFNRDDFNFEYIRAVLVMRKVHVGMETNNTTCYSNNYDAAMDQNDTT